MHLTKFDLLDVDGVALILEMMPSAMEPVVDVIGLKSTYHLIEAFAGQTFVMPKYPRAAGRQRFSDVARAIGIDAAFQMSKHFGGERLFIPRMAVLLRKLRSREIIRDFDAALKVMGAGAAANQLATKYEPTYRQIEVIANGKSVNSSYKRPSWESLADKSKKALPVSKKP